MANHQVNMGSSYRRSTRGGKLHHGSSSHMARINQPDHCAAPSSKLPNSPSKPLSVFLRIKFPSNYYQSNYSNEFTKKVHRDHRRNSVSISKENVGGFRKRFPVSNYKGNPGDQGVPLSKRFIAVICYRCLSPGHHIFNCKNKVRCKTCLTFEHYSWNCKNRFPKMIYRPKPN